MTFLPFHERYQLLNYHGGSIDHLAFSRDGGLLASAGDDGALCFFDVRSGQLVHVIQLGPRQRPTFLLWTAACDIFIACSNGLVIQLEITAGENDKVWLIYLPIYLHRKSSI